MALAGDTIENPLTGERITFLNTTSETNGELLRFEYLLPPGFSVPEHVHVGQEERHEILSGTLRGRVRGYERDFAEGQQMIGPADVPHAWGNASDAEAMLVVSELRPALRFEPLIETAFVIAGDWKRSKMAFPKHLLRIAMLLDGARDDFYPAQMPMPAWKTLLALNASLACLGRSLGYDDYPGLEQDPERDGSRPAGNCGAQAAFLAAGTLAVHAAAEEAGGPADGSRWVVMDAVAAPRSGVRARIPR